MNLGPKINSFSKWLPTPGSILFTLLIAALLFYTQRANALPGTVLTNGPAATSITTFPYQGRLSDTNGNPVNTTVAMTFHLYNISSGGNALWTEAWPSVQVNEGLFNVLLGSTTSLTSTIFAENASLWLGISVGTDTEMTPRVQLGTGAFAVQANRAYGLNAMDGNPQDAVFVDTDGKVGIGTINPENLLHILGPAIQMKVDGSGNDSSVQIAMVDGQSNGQEWRLVAGPNNSGGFEIYNATSGLPMLDILPSGNIGIGTTDPKLKLHLIGTSGLPATSGTTQLGTARFQVSGYSTVLDFGAEGPTTGKQWIQATDAGNLGATYPLLLNPNGGNIGIGTPNPSSVIDITGNGSSIPTLELTNTFDGLSDSPKTFYLDVSSNGCIGRKLSIGFSEGTDPDDYDLCTGASSLMVIDSGGNIGVGTTTPVHKFDVVGDIYSSGVICANNGSNCLPAPSDLNLKTNITLLTNPLDKLTQLHGVTFDWNDEGTALGLSNDTSHIGVIAQEVEAVFPGMVTTMENGYKAVDYSEFSAVLIEAVKELRAEKDSEIAALQTEVTDLKTQLALVDTNKRQIISSGNTMSDFGFFLGVLVGLGSAWMGFETAKRRMLNMLTQSQKN